MHSQRHFIVCNAVPAWRSYAIRKDGAIPLSMKASVALSVLSLVMRVLLRMFITCLHTSCADDELVSLYALSVAYRDCDHASVGCLVFIIPGHGRG